MNARKELVFEGFSQFVHLYMVIFLGLRLTTSATSLGCCSVLSDGALASRAALLSSWSTALLRGWTYAPTTTPIIITTAISIRILFRWTAVVEGMRWTLWVVKL